MVKAYIIYNPLSGERTCLENAKYLEICIDDNITYIDITRIKSYSAFINGLEADDYIILAGGDGTLNRFINDTIGIPISQEILYFPTGISNDFACDLQKSAYTNPFPINKYITQLPTVEIKGKTYRFLNAVGFGIDGYCCQMGDVLHKSPDQKVNYTSIAVKGLLGKFKPRNAKVTVDGITYCYKKVWTAPTLNGRYYGGGMMAAPEQNRLSEEKTLSLMLLHNSGRLRTLCIFPSIFKGNHVKHHKQVAISTGHEITVEFDRPTPLQVDGETILDVTSYTVRATKKTN